MKRKVAKISFLLTALAVYSSGLYAQHALVFQTDFGLEDGAVASMKGVAYRISPELKMFDITHTIPQFNIWEAAYRLNQTAKYWPSGTVFVSVIDPGVGTDRKSVVLKTKSGHYFVSPDNGSLTLVAEYMGIDEVREIDEAVNRLKGSEGSHTFHGRDVYAYTGARLAAGVIRFAEVGRLLKDSVVRINYARPILADGILKGNIPILDTHFGNIWTNIDQALFNKLAMQPGEKAWVRITSGTDAVYEERLTFVRSFGGVGTGEPAIYINDLFNLALAINQGDFAEKYKINAGPEWNIEIWR